MLHSIADGLLYVNCAWRLAQDQAQAAEGEAERRDRFSARRKNKRPFAQNPSVLSNCSTWRRAGYRHEFLLNSAALAEKSHLVPYRFRPVPAGKPTDALR